jgi:hypothetical protein
MFFRIRIIDKGKKIICFWFPCILLWILLLPFVILAFLLALLGDILTLCQFRLTRLYIALLALTSELKGTFIDIDNSKTNSHVQVTIL